MTIQGSLREMMVADLIQHACIDGQTACVTLERNQGQDTATIFFDAGQVVHASCGTDQGEDAIYALLGWDEGTFKLENDVPPPTKTVKQDYVTLLLAGAQRLDEANGARQSIQEKETMTKKKGEQLAELLDQVLSESTDLEGAAVVGTDGLVYSINVPSGKFDEELVGAVAAAILGASRRSTEQLNRGNFNQTLIQGVSGNIIVTPLNTQTLFVTLTPAKVNLGMAFAETRNGVDKLAEVV